MSNITLPRPPNDPETLVIFEAQVEIADLQAWHQVWRWGTYQAHSLIFPAASVKDLSDETLKSTALEPGLAHADTRFTFKRSDEWVFMNFNLIDLDD